MSKPDEAGSCSPLQSYLELLRLPNVFTAVADVAMIDTHSVIVLGKGYGVTQVLVTDHAHRVGCITRRGQPLGGDFDTFDRCGGRSGVDRGRVCLPPGASNHRPH